MSIARSCSVGIVLLAALSANVQAQQPAAPEPGPASPAAPAPAAPAPAATAEYKIVTTEPIHAVVLPMKGSYMQHPAAFQQLGSYLAGRGITPDGAPFARYFSDPAVGEDNLVWEVGFKVPAGVKVEAPFEVKEIPGALTVVHVHRGSYDDLMAAWTQFMQWVFANGYQVEGPATMVFKDMTAPEVELELPVRK